jgi:6-pyruvoyltetrahydropterin/6-carboxytetrahydropterin synthase
MSADTTSTNAVRLTRTIRIALPEEPATGANTHNAYPAPTGFAPYYEFDAQCTGDPDPDTGYLISIHEIDTAFRDHALPVLRAGLLSKRLDPAAILPNLFAATRDNLPVPLTALTWRLTPNQSLTMTTTSTTTDTSAVILTERFEFAAAHRLAVKGNTQEQNHALFGKCANPNYHGHNYILQTQTAVPTDRLADTSLATRIARTVDEHAIDALDHKNLNLDVPRFDPSRDDSVIPSVENIARFCYESLAPHIADLGASLLRVTVWETERTSATYPA